MKEFLTLHVGQAGNQIGFALWELLIAEHGLSPQGELINKNNDNEAIGYYGFFKMSHQGKFIPRAIFIDMDPMVISQMKTSVYRQLYHPDQLITGGNDSASNFARAYHTEGRMLFGQIYNQIRKQIEACDYLQGILIYRALSGGCGSGLTALMMEILFEYMKMPRIEIPIHPSPHFDSCVVAPYNSLLGEHFMIDDIDIGILLDNEAMFNIVTEELQVTHPTFPSINRVLAQVCSSLTASTRFSNQLVNDFTRNLVNLVPYPRIHFPITSYSPFYTENHSIHESLTTKEITQALFDRSNQLALCDLHFGRMMCCSIVYRGVISPSEIYTTLTKIKTEHRIKFVDWCPTGFKVGVVDQPPTIIPDSCIAKSIDKNAIMLSNNSIVSSVWHRLCQRYQFLHSKRSFIHWYVGEGLEESEFCEALYNIVTLAKDYEEVSFDTKLLEKENEKDNDKDKSDDGEGESNIEVTKTADFEGGGMNTKTEITPATEESSESSDSQTESSNIFREKLFKKKSKEKNDNSLEILSSNQSNTDVFIHNNKKTNNDKMLHSKHQLQASIKSLYALLNKPKNNLSPSSSTPTIDLTPSISSNNINKTTTSPILQNLLKSLRSETPNTKHNNTMTDVTECNDDNDYGVDNNSCYLNKLAIKSNDKKSNVNIFEKTETFRKNILLKKSNNKSFYKKLNKQKDKKSVYQKMTKDDQKMTK